MNNIIRILILAIIGGLIGYITNVIAIKLIFRPINPITYNIVPTHPLLALISDDFDESLDLKMKYPMGSTTIATRRPIPTSEPCGNGKSGSFGSYLGPAKELNEIKNAANNKKNFLFFIWL